MVPALYIFDCDGTLIDTERVHVRLQRQTLAELGLDLSESYMRENITGQRFTLTLEKLSQTHGLVVPKDATDTYKQRFLSEMDKIDMAMPNARATVLTLAEHHKVCVASNGRRVTICSYMQQIHLMPPLTMGQIFSFEDVAYPKPAPDLFLHAMQQMGETDPKAVMVIEDSFVGIRAGLAAGMNVTWMRPDLPVDAAVPAEFAGRISVISDLSQLLAT